jgi:LAO/AO transport system kinase
VSASTATTAPDVVAERVAEQVLDGHVRSATRLITQSQDGDPLARRVMSLLYPHCGRARLIGITGPPGAGKSTLVAGMIGELRRRGLTVGVIAVDPSSPFSGGAVLGDRDRMTGYSSDAEVFIRSMASRGAIGGLCAVANDAVDVMDAMGKDVVLIETVGVGQSEVEIAQIANTVVLTLVPGYGDELQAMKAGIMEAADIIVVNKADSPGANGAVAELQNMGYFQAVPQGEEMWQVPVVKMSALRNEGFDELEAQILRQSEFAEKTGWKAARQRRRRVHQFAEVVTDGVRRDFLGVMQEGGGFDGLLDRIGALQVDPYAAAQGISRRLRTLIKDL